MPSRRSSVIIEALDNRQDVIGWCNGRLLISPGRVLSVLGWTAGFPPLSVPDDSLCAGLQTFLRRETRFSTTTIRAVPPTVPPLLDPIRRRALPSPLVLWPLIVVPLLLSNSILIPKTMH